MSWFEFYLDEIPMVYPYQRGINEKYPLPGLGENPLFVYLITTTTIRKLFMEPMEGQLCLAIFFLNFENIP